MTTAFSLLPDDAAPEAETAPATSEKPQLRSPGRPPGKFKVPVAVAAESPPGEPAPALEVPPTRARRYRVLRDAVFRFGSHEVRWQAGRVVTDQGYAIEALRAAGVALEALVD